MAENWLSRVISEDKTLVPEGSQWSSAMPGCGGWVVSRMQLVVRAENHHDLAFLAYFRNLWAVQHAAPVRNGHLPRLCISDCPLAEGFCGHRAEDEGSEACGLVEIAV